MTDQPALTRTAFDPADLIRGEDGDLYHLPTLRALHARGQLGLHTEGYLLLQAHDAQRHPARRAYA